jgi:uncharacterized protein (DUF1501 family)
MKSRFLLPRQFLGVAATAATLPAFVVRTSQAAAANDPRVLVVVQLAGGNDGLNTVVPFGNDTYYRSRRKVAVPADKVLRLNDELGLHPELAGLKQLYDEGGLAIVQNVGYPNPNRSHFRSTEIWETASSATSGSNRSDGNRGDTAAGWIGRYFDLECRGAPQPMLGMQIGERACQTFAHPEPRSVTLANPDLFAWPTSGPVARGLSQLNGERFAGSETLDFLQRTANQTIGLSRQIQEAVRQERVSGDYLPFAFQQSLRLVAQMIAAEIPTRVYYVSLTGFDTHANQTNRHAALLQELSQGLSTFCRDLAQLGHLDRTLVMTFSEFGRRVAENESAGTDHGTANVMFLAGGNVRAGIFGDAPNLDDLDQGDLKYRHDFRSVYATVLEKWLGADSRSVLQGSYATLPVLG